MRQSLWGMMTGIVLVALIVAGNAIARGVPGQWIARGGANLLIPVSRGLHALWTVPGSPEALERGGDIKSIQAERDALAERVAFLEAAVGIRDRISSAPIAGGILAMHTAGGVREVFVNRGSDDGVALGDVVISGSARLIGVVRTVAARQSAVRVLGDPGLEIAVRIIGTEISGLIRPDTAGGIMLDLVRKDEPVSEGQTVATSGDDQFPSGIIIGTVRSVEDDATLLFKTVRIAPAIDMPPHGPILITGRHPR